MASCHTRSAVVFTNKETCEISTIRRPQYGGAACLFEICDLNVIPGFQAVCWCFFSDFDDSFNLVTFVMKTDKFKIFLKF
jgi:hypothetical protein